MVSIDEIVQFIIIIEITKSHFEFKLNMILLSFDPCQYLIQNLVV